MRRTWLFVAVLALCPLAAVGWHFTRAQGSKPADAPQAVPTKKLPITQVVLFNTGLGYFQREGEVEGDVRIDLSVPTSDVNDLLKSMLIDNGGKPISVSYEGVEPIEGKLQSYALDLSENPTLAELLMQARGEKVELTLEGAGTTPLTGTLVGVEAGSDDKGRDAPRLNVLCSDGARRLPLDRVARVRFLDSALEEEFRRALSVLSAGRIDQRRLVSVHLKGEGKRKVKIGYVAETPIWKATYRLLLDGKGVKPALKGFAIVENTTEEDWNDVRLILVSGRPITFKMNVAQQLFMPRPSVDPEVFASLRPPTPAPTTQLGPLDDEPPERRTRPAGNFGGGNLGGFGGGGFGGNALGHALGLGGQFQGTAGMSQQESPARRVGANRGVAAQPRLSYEDLLKRRQEMLAQRKQAARDVGGTLVDLGAEIDDVFTNADTLGEGFRYSLEPRVNLPRQRAAMLPLPGDGETSLARLSVYAPSVHPRFAMQTVRLKNTSGEHLMQGPVAVFDDAQYVGDCRLPDMQPGQTRLLSFAMDLGVEVRPDAAKEPAREVVSMEVVKGVVETRTRATRRTTYHLLNRSKSERVVVVEQPLTGWTLTSEKPAETTRRHYRFEWAIAAGKTASRTVVETSDEVTRVSLVNLPDAHVTALAESPHAGPAVKALLGKAIAENRHAAAVDADARKTSEELREIEQEVDRVTKMLAKLPAGSGPHKSYLADFEKLDPQAKRLRKMEKEKLAAAAKAQEERESSLRELSAK